MKNSVDHERLQSILEYWPLGGISSVEEILNGAVNQVYRIQASLGNFYLRLYKTSERARVEREHTLLEYVAAHNLPAVQTLPSRYGSSLIEHEGKFGALYFESPGKQIAKSQLTTLHAQAAGRMLAQLHKVLEPLPDVGYRKYSLSWDKAEWVDRLQRIETAIQSRPSLIDADKWVLQRLQAQKEWMQNPVCEHLYVPKYPAQVLHGDFHQGNLFFQKETVCGVIDWDQAVFMPRAFEVVRVASYMFDLQPEMTRVFLKAYLDLNPLKSDELEDGARAWGCHSDHYVWAQEEIYFNNNERARVFIPEVPFVPFHALWSKLGL